jgi:hypothetical protein
MGDDDFVVQSQDSVFLFNATHNLWAATPTLQNIATLDGSAETRYYPVLTPDKNRATLVRVANKAYVDGDKTTLSTGEVATLKFISSESRNQYAGVLSTDSGKTSTSSAQKRPQAQLVLYQSTNNNDQTSWIFTPSAGATGSPVGSPVGVLYGSKYLLKNPATGLFLSNGYKLVDEDYTFGIDNCVFDDHVDEWLLVPSKALYESLETDPATCACPANPHRGVNNVLAGFSCSTESSNSSTASAATQAGSYSSAATQEGSYVCRNAQGLRLSLSCKKQVQLDSNVCRPSDDGGSSTISIIALRRDTRSALAFELCILAFTVIGLSAFVWFALRHSATQPSRT